MGSSNNYGYTDVYDVYSYGLKLTCSSIKANSTLIQAFCTLSSAEFLLQITTPNGTPVSWN